MSPCKDDAAAHPEGGVWVVQRLLQLPPQDLSQRTETKLLQMVLCRVALAFSLCNALSKRTFSSRPLDLRSKACKLHKFIIIIISKCFGSLLLPFVPGL